MGSDYEGGSSDAFLREIAQIDSPDARGLAPEARYDDEHAIGSRLGRFVVQSELGRGGMGIVYRAQDDTLGRVVALKVLGKSRDRSPERRARFLREARSAASIVHPNVATVYEIGEAGASLYIAMELVSGNSLRHRFSAGRPLPTDEVVTLARGIARGLEAAHAQGIVHRDLKPENVMVDATGQPKILDFGLAKLRNVREAPREVLEHQPTDSPSTEDGRILGTPAYMSPEQAAGKLLDARSDLFSLGVVLYEALTASRPFTGETSHELLASVMRDTPVSVRSVNAGAHPGLAALVMRCLAKPAAERPPSARDFLQSLDAIGDARRMPRRWRVLLGGVGLALVATGLLIAMMQRTSPPIVASPDPSAAPPTTVPMPLAAAPTVASAEPVASSASPAIVARPPASSPPAIKTPRPLTVPAVAAPSAQKRDPLGDQN
jgi:eukaryotic-like serine/threonine-protein kinase